MKRITLFLSLSIFLASCADAATPIQTPVLTATKEATATSTPTNTPEPTPTATPRPEGAPTDADAHFDVDTKTWTKKVTNEFGEEVVAKWVPASEHGEVFAGWYVPHGGFPLIPKGQYIVQGGYTYPGDELMIEFSVKEGMTGPNIRIERSKVERDSWSGKIADNILRNSNPGRDILGMLTNNQTLLRTYL
jgi:hypothetical protein